jgi:hypothetical protein
LSTEKGVTWSLLAKQPPKVSALLAAIQTYIMSNSLTKEHDANEGGHSGDEQDPMDREQEGTQGQVLGDSEVKEQGPVHNWLNNLPNGLGARDSTNGSMERENVFKGLKELSWDFLRLRRVSKIPTEDKMSKLIQPKLVGEPFQLQFKDIGGLQSILQNFLGKCEMSKLTDDSYTDIEDLLNGINEWKFESHLTSITDRDFEKDIAQSKSSNEAVTKQTLMISMLDRWQLPELFVYNCECQWIVDPRHLLPVTGRMQEVALPKPDLAIFFKLGSLLGSNVWAPYPGEISCCLRPDGGDERCFPFFFMEVKGADGNIESAFRANLLNASQALYNIFVWMSRAGQEKIFFDNVRIFTMDLSAREIHLRMHRAIRDEENYLTYHFTDIISLIDYNRGQACHPVRNVIYYAEKELHGILKRTFQDVSQQEKNLAQAEPPKREEDDDWTAQGYDRPEASTTSMPSSTGSRCRSTLIARTLKSRKKPVITVSPDEDRFLTELLNHNIDIYAEKTPDGKLAELEKLALRYWKSPGDNDHLEARWRYDMDMCKSNKAAFQRIIMMDIIDRDNLDKILSYTFEVPWVANRMPSHNQFAKLTQPKPDMVFAFKTDTLLKLPSPSVMCLGNIWSHIFAEGLENTNRAFHFFSIEAGVYAENSVAEYQNINTASQGLHNIYVVMKEAGLEDDFIKDVRFFSVVATATSFDIRVHRPAKLEPGDYIDQGCGVRFCFDEFLTLGSNYTRAKASTVVNNILFHYGVKKLHPILKRSLEIVLKKGAKRARDDNAGFGSNASRKKSKLIPCV